MVGVRVRTRLLLVLLLLPSVADAADLRWRWRGAHVGYIGHVLMPAADPDREDAASLLLVDDETGEQVACLAAGPAELVEVVIPGALGTRRIVRAYATSEADCGGLVSDPSDDRARLPARPAKVEVRP